jgi:hypothetical protein
MPRDPEDAIRNDGASGSSQDANSYLAGRSQDLLTGFSEFDSLSFPFFSFVHRWVFEKAVPCSSSAARSFHRGFLLSIKAILVARVQRLSCSSRFIALLSLSWLSQ